MKEIIPADTHYLAISLLVTIGLQLTCFFIAYCAQFDTITDFSGGMNFVLIALLTFLANGAYTERGIAITTLVLISRVELALFLFYRVLRRGRDSRFDEIRTHFWRFLGFWVAQILWVWVVSLPVMFVNGDAANPAFGSGRDVAGIVIFCIGFLYEVVADFQKDAFRKNPANAGKPCTLGVWKHSRHPNFFGEILLWWGIFILASPVFSASASNWGYVTIFSPLFTFFILMFLSGMPTAEGDYQRRFMKTHASRDAFLRYRNRTSILVPLPHFVYANLPMLIRRVFLFEYRRYETDWSYCGEDAAGNTAQSSPSTAAASSQKQIAAANGTRSVDASSVRLS